MIDGPDRFVTHAWVQREQQGGVPGGTVEPGETPAHADVRETLEEAGLVVIAGEEISHYTNPDTNGRPLTFHALTYLGT